MGPQTYMESKRIVAAQMCIALDHQGLFMALLEQHGFAKDGKILEEMAPYIINSDEVGISLIGKQSKSGLQGQAARAAQACEAAVCDCFSN